MCAGLFESCTVWTAGVEHVHAAVIVGGCIFCRLQCVWMHKMQPKIPFLLGMWIKGAAGGLCLGCCCTAAKCAHLQCCNARQLMTPVHLTAMS